MHFVQDTGTILDASEDEQLEAAIKASLAENADPLNSVNDDTNDNDIDDEDGEESGSVEEWFDSESESRTSEPKNPHKSETHKVVHLESAEEETNIEAVKTETELEPDQDWEQHLGPETDLVSSIVFRYPDGNKEQKSFTSSSSILVISINSIVHLIIVIRMCHFFPGSLQVRCGQRISTR